MECYESAKELISKNKEALVRIAETLLEREVLDSHQIEALIKGETLEPIKAATPTKKEGPAADEKAEKKGSQTEEAEKKKALGGRPVKQPG